MYDAWLGSYDRRVPGYRAVVFDFFGTLTHAIQRGPQHTRVARLLGCDPGEFTRLLNRSFFARAQGRYGSAESTLRWVCGQLGTSPPADLMRYACAVRVDAIRADTRLRAAAVPVLRSLREQGLRVALVSDCGHELPVILPTLPIARLLDAVVLSVDIGHCKPHPAMYLTACRRLGVAPGECLYVGDGGSHELTGAVST